MTVKKLVKKTHPSKAHKEDLSRIDDFISGGGKTTEESTSSTTKEDDQLSRFTVRMPPQFVKLIDQKRSENIGNISRNTWILEAIAQRLKNEG